MSGITSLTTLTALPTSLVTLNLSGMTNLSTAGLTPIVGLTHLTTLNLSGDTTLAGLPSLAALTNLVTFDMSGATGIINLPSFSTLAHLETLNLDSMTSLADLPAGMDSLSSLTSLSIKGYTPQNTGDHPKDTMMVVSKGWHLSWITSIPHFATFDKNNPATLNISNTDITDARFLNGCEGLTHLFWEFTTYPDESNIHMPSCKNLYYLDLSYNVHLGSVALGQIAAIPSFQTKNTTDGIGKETLTIGGNNMKSVSALSSDQGLNALYWHDMNDDVHYYAPGMVHILTNTEAGTLADLKNLTHLADIDLNNDTGLDANVLTKIKEMTHVKSLGLHNCNISNINELQTMTQLTYLSLGDNPITDISPLQHMSHLDSVNLTDDYVSDISYLIGLPLSSINLYGNYLDPTPLSQEPDNEDMKNITTLKNAGVICDDYTTQCQIPIDFACDGTKGTMAPTSVNKYYQQKFTPPTVTPINPVADTFLGWDTDPSNGTGTADIQAGQPVAVTAALPLSTITFNAVFGPTQYHAAFDTHNGSAVSTQTVAYNNHAARPADPTRYGYTFEDWYTDTSYNTKWDFNTAILSNVTIYAKWNANACTISFDAAGGDPVAQIAAKYDDAISLLDATKPGFLFGGWYTDASYSTRVSSSPYIVNGSPTLVAKWNTKSLGTCQAKKMPSKAIVGTDITVLQPLTPKGFTPVQVTYTSNSAGAPVSPGGNIQFLSGGKVTITVILTCQKTVKGKTTTKKVTVKKTITVTQPVASISFNQYTVPVAVKGKVTLTPNIRPSTATNHKVKWKSSSPGVASVSSSGVVTGKKAGSATITCTAQDGSKVFATITIIVS